MRNRGLDPHLLHAWLYARSIARGLPLPVPDHGGFRVDTHSKTEIVRWVFPKMGPGLEELAQSIAAPGHLLKLCGAADELQTALPTGWALHAPAYVMRARGAPTARPLAGGYRIETEHTGMVMAARIFSDAGEMAASGYATQTQDAFIYDRIVTEPQHRRKGLGHAIMATLRTARQNPASPELLVATTEGRALYSTLGWETISPYSTASIPDPASGP
ncbi:hypothetical protein AEAC466_19910 [Asticcacaulis sp. AC466]|uniref:GNAT family N-acetyltransferase n=1 Tax=Asticcacaulis sp. AC466 TaxID=1282362 RepID=UPI0003C3E018|nr:GNAT family N-acetyltransferase [Asticcacaulis sp. AC466]ESQ81831.1 hypothetical protein AEAC466_19910 [Asticcacaulis sp. AC466]